MQIMRLLLLSNSTNPGEAYLSWAKAEIARFMGNVPTTALFIPYAAVSISYDEYEAKVDAVFSALNCKIKSIHREWDPVYAVESAENIIIGGGNTWRLVQLMRERRLIEAIKTKVEAGTPYIGWSAGSNVACPTMKTTNFFRLAATAFVFLFAAALAAPVAHAQDLGAIKAKMAARLPPIGVPLDLAVEIAWNYYNDRKLLQLELIDWRESE